MALRFRRSIKLAPGVRLNLSGSGVSWSLGPRGSTVNVGKRGGTLSQSLMGFNHQSKLWSPPNAASRPPPHTETTARMRAIVDTEGDGRIIFVDRDTGEPMSEHWVELAKKQNREALQGLLQTACDEVNGQLEALARIHWDTPAQDKRPVFVGEPFKGEEPPRPDPKPLTFMAKLFRSKRQEIEADNSRAEDSYRRALAAFEADREQHHRVNGERRKFLEVDIYEDPEAMSRWLEANLQDINWPRETLVAFEIRCDKDEGSGGYTVLVDVDFPEVEDMPQKSASVPQRGLKLSLKPLAAARVQQAHLEHVHGVAFRIVGEVFAALPVVQLVVLSGYTQRADKATGKEVDEYVLSVRVERSKWAEIDFGRLPQVDPVIAVSRFQVRREVLKTGRMKAIEPFTG